MGLFLDLLIVKFLTPGISPCNAFQNKSYTTQIGACNLALFNKEQRLRKRTLNFVF